MNKREELQKLCDRIEEKIIYLKNKKIIEANALAIFQLEKEIEETEAELSKITEQIENLDTASVSHELYHALSKLGYQKQVLSFKKFIKTQSIAGFLIHGSPDHGQRWLLNRLMRQHLDDGTTSKVLKVELHRMGRRSDVNTLWRELGGRVGLKRQNSPLEIAERVYQWWQTQNVILIFHDVDCMPQDYLREFIQDFWLPLATQARESVSQSRKFRLLMFFVDYEGCVGNRDTLFVEQVEPNQGPKIPIKLPIINPFCQQVLRQWIETLEMDFDKLPLMEVMSQMPDPVQEILDNSENGIPELAFSEICDWSGCNWYEAEKIWLIH
ncbi:MAG: hypothetical protein DSM106950_40360 [Stigonema ocellatum SAG 48.90 = DSM 106950]|nr:hypothetical protein [Stigonema ocellatum SAG 48.90 = DSM 106950]